MCGWTKYRAIDTEAYIPGTVSSQKTHRHAGEHVEI